MWQMDQINLTRVLLSMPGFIFQPVRLSHRLTMAQCFIINLFLSIYSVWDTRFSRCWLWRSEMWRTHSSEWPWQHHRWPGWTFWGPVACPGSSAILMPRLCHMTDQKMELALAVEKVKPSARPEKQPESAGDLSFLSRLSLEEHQRLSHL